MAETNSNATITIAVITMMRLNEFLRNGFFTDNCKLEFSFYMVYCLYCNHPGGCVKLLSRLALNSRSLSVQHYLLVDFKISGIAG